MYGGFKMKKRIDITIDEMVLKLIDDYAKDNGISRSAAITILIMNIDRRMNYKINNKTLGSE